MNPFDVVRKLGVRMLNYPHLSAIQEHIGGTIRVPRHGVPHLVIFIGGVEYSICWFGRRKGYKVFFPYPTKDEDDLLFEITFNQIGDVVFYFIYRVWNFTEGSILYKS